MSKQKRTILLGLVAVVILVGLMLVLLFTQKKDDTDPSSMSSTSVAETYPLIEDNVDNFTSLQVTNEQGTYTITPSGENEYTDTELAQFKQNSAAYASAVSSLSNLSATKKVLDTVENKAEYGLETPVANAVITFGDKSYQLYLGNEVAASNYDGYYVMLEGDEALYTISSNNGKILTRNNLYYLDKQLLPDYDRQDTEAIPKVTYLKFERPEMDTIELKEFSGSTEHRLYSSSFEMVSPVSSEIDIKVDEELVMIMFGMNASQVVDVYDETKASQYGFDNPNLKIEMTYDNQSFQLTVGKPAQEIDNEGNVTESLTSHYVLCNDNGLVYQVDKAFFPTLDKTADDFISKNAILPYIADLDKIVLTLNGTVYQFDLFSELGEVNEDSSQEPKMEIKSVTYNGQELTLASFQKYYQLMFYPQIEKINTEPVSGDPTAKIEVYYSNGDQETMEFYEIDSRRMRVSVNGQANFEARSGYISKMITEMEHLLNGETVDTDW